MNDNVIDATDFFLRRKMSKSADLEKNLGNNRAFRAYCDCIGQLAIQKLIASDCYDEDIDDGFFSFESDDIVDVTMQESVTKTAEKLADHLIKECTDGGVKICVDSILFRKLIYGKVPDRVGLKIRVGSRTA